MWTTATLATGASWGQVTVLAHSGVLWSPLNLFTSLDMKVTVILEADTLREKERLCLLIEEVAGIEEIESSQLYQYCHISQRALNMIEQTPW